MKRFEPHPYQAYCIDRLVHDPAVGLFLDMGLGKTVITLTAVTELRYNRFAVRRCLIVAPKKVAEATWSREAAKWEHLQALRIVTVLGTLKRRIRALNTPGDVYVINRDNVRWLVDYYKNAWPFDMVVLDESTSFKSHDTSRFKALAWIRPHVTRMVLLTGTPAPNGLLDLWTQIYLLDGGDRLGRHFTHYRERYFEPDRRGRDRVYSYAPKEGAEEAIWGKLADICVSMVAEDYLQLPECVTEDVPVELDVKARTAYDTMEREMLLQVDEDMIDAASAAALSNKLLQLCNGAMYTDTHEVVPIHDCKLEMLCELVGELCGRPALVFYNFRFDISRIIEVLAPFKLRIRVLDGPADEQAWNEREVDILLAHPASCAYGLNLQDGGNHVIWFGLNWSLELYQQANRRLWRQGQTERVIIHRLVVVGGRDEDVAEALSDKAATQDRLISSLKARIGRVKSENPVSQTGK